MLPISDFQHRIGHGHSDDDDTDHCYIINASILTGVSDCFLNSYCKTGMATRNRRLLISTKARSFTNYNFILLCWQSFKCKDNSSVCVSSVNTEVPLQTKPGCSFEHGGDIGSQLS